MERIVFRYRALKAPAVVYYVLPAFMFATAYGTWSGVIPVTDHFGRMMTSGPSVNMAHYFPLALGLFFLTLCVQQTLVAKNSRIVIENGEIIFYDHLGQQKVRGSLSTAHLDRPNEERNAQKIVTEGGTIGGLRNYANYEELKALIQPYAPEKRLNGFLD